MLPIGTKLYRTIIVPVTEWTVMSWYRTVCYGTVAGFIYHWTVSY